MFFTKQPEPLAAEAVNIAEAVLGLLMENLKGLLVSRDGVADLVELELGVVAELFDMLGVGLKGLFAANGVVQGFESLSLLDAMGEDVLTEAAVVVN